MYILTWEFWKDALSRVIRTFCQTLASVMGGTALNVWTAGWGASVGVALGSALVSFLMCVDRAFARSEIKITEVIVQPDQQKVEAP